MARRKTGRWGRGGSGRSVRLTMVSAVLVAAGLLYLMAGMALLLQPEWYYEHVGPFGTYNRLVLGQVGALLLPLGAAMIIASQNPTENRMVVGVGASGAILLAFNQMYAASTGELPSTAWITSVFPLLLLATFTAWAFWQVRPRLRRSS